jgi:polysaccharide deacetylase family protein (PEP-CTERM system associated)
MKNILSFDIEDWFHPQIFGDIFDRENWDKLESRVKESTEIILNFLSKNNLKATFFYLGWVAERCPEIVEITAKEGHEIGVHGYSHIRLDMLTPNEFRDELRLCLNILSSVSGKEPVGYRAPTFSITKKTLWALPILLEEGIRYDSSIYPIYHDRYGIPDAPKYPHVIYKNGKDSLLEFPMSTVQIWKYNLPFGGGGYLRLYPFWLTIRLMRKCNKNNKPIIFYAHPWEFDTNLPKVGLSLFGKLRHYAGINKFLERMTIITDMFEFTSFEKSSLWEMAAGAEEYIPEKKLKYVGT